MNKILHRRPCTEVFIDLEICLSLISRFTESATSRVVDVGIPRRSDDFWVGHVRYEVPVATGLIFSSNFHHLLFLLSVSYPSDTLPVFLVLRQLIPVKSDKFDTAFVIVVCRCSLICIFP